MDKIDSDVLAQAAKHVDACAIHGEVHTVILVTDGATGGARLTVEGSGFDGEEFRYEFHIGGIRDGEGIPVVASPSYR